MGLDEDKELDHQCEIGNQHEQLLAYMMDIG